VLDRPNALPNNASSNSPSPISIAIICTVLMHNQQFSLKGVSMNINRRDILKLFGLGAAATAAGAPQADAQSQYFTLTILHSNDTHDRLEPTTLTGKDAAGKDYKVQYGGVARVKTLIEELKARSMNPIVLDAGDVFTGTLYGTVYKGLADLAYIEAWGVQAHTLGNHEFDGGPAQLAEYLKAASFPVVSANVDASAEPLLKGLFKPSTVITVRGQKIGVVGMTTPSTPVTSTPGDKVKFMEPLEPVQKEVDALRAQGIRYIIVLSHLGYDQDLLIAQKLKGVGVIVGGHSHTPLGKYSGNGLPASNGNYPTVLKDAAGQDILVAQVWEWAKFYGQLRVSFDNNGTPITWTGKVHPVTEAIKPDVRLAATLKAFTVPLESFRNQVVATAAVRLNGDRADVRKRETNLGNLISDGYLWKTQGAGTTIALMNGGGIRTSIEPGPVTVAKAIEVQPFGNTVYVMALSGAEVRAALENGVSQWEAGAGRFLQVAGLKYTFDLAKAVGGRVTEVLVKTKDGFVPLDEKASYKVVTNNFIAVGGDGFDVLKNAKGERYDTYLTDYVVVNEYFASLKSVEAKVEGRITILNEKK
jgi:5'-nucleotidase / UDP-sugar diphosphatase